MIIVLHKGVYQMMKDTVGSWGPPVHLAVTIKMVQSQQRLLDVQVKDMMENKDF